MIGWMLGGLAVLVLGGLAVRGGDRLHSVPLDVLDRVIVRVSKSEGGFDSLNLNRDGAGLSFGMLQWAQRPKQLGVLLAAMAEAEPRLFVEVFGPASSALLEATAAGSVGAVDGAVLWREPWVSRFKRAGREPAFQAVQVKLAREGEHMVGAVQAWRLLGVGSEVALTLCFDTAVQQGPAFAVRLAERVTGRQIADERERLWAYARGCAAPFRRRSAPERAHPVKALRWVRHGERDWRVWAGEIELWSAVWGRRRRILRM